VEAVASGLVLVVSLRVPSLLPEMLVEARAALAVSALHFRHEGESDRLYWVDFAHG
jgi:hypothetical protein